MFDNVEDVLEHYGIKGMKWGVRRKRGSNGRVGGGKSNTSSSAKKEKGKKGATVVIGRKKAQKKNPLADIPDDALQKAVARMELEKRYVTLSAEQAERSKTRGQKFMDEVGKSAGSIAKSQGQRAANAYVGKVIDDQLKKAGITKKKDRTKNKDKKNKK